MKTCSKCGAEKELETGFYRRSKGSPDGFKAMCKSCDNARHRDVRRRSDSKQKWYARLPRDQRRTRTRASWLRRKYSMTSAQFEAMFDAQGGKCAICDRELPSMAHVDHDHVSGTVRGILCPRCNRGLGQFLDDAETLIRAANYLTHHRIRLVI